MNRLIIIGFMGDKLAYLNVNREEAITRYRNQLDDGHWDKDNFIEFMDKIEKDHIEEFTFTDEFAVYDAWGIE